MVTLRNPEAPASSKQLWLLHILTKQDTRNWQLTMQQASDKIEELKGNGHKPKVDLRTNVTTLPGLDIVEAYKSVSLHRDTQVTVEVKARAIFPGGKKPHIISSYTSGNKVHISPLYAYIKNDVTIDRTTFEAWIRHLPIRFSKVMPVPEDKRELATRLARRIHRTMDIIPLQ